MEAQPTTGSFKLFFGDNDVRRVSLPLTRFDDVVAALQQLYSTENLFHPELRIQYIDGEGDKITVSSQIEWQEMLQQVSARPIKLYISESSLQGRYFKDGPPPEFRYFYTDNDRITDPKDSAYLSTLQTAVPACLERLFPGGKILPFNLPEWLRESNCITVKRNGNNLADIDFDIDVKKLLKVLLHQSLQHFGTETTPMDLAKAKDFLYCMLAIESDNTLALYNLACAEALLGNTEEALNALEKAVNVGKYSDWRHMEKDPDLDSIRSHAKYQEVETFLKDNDEKIKEEKRRQAEEEEAAEARRQAEEEERKKQEEEERKRQEEEKRIERHEEEEAEKKKKEEEEKREKILKESPYKVQLGVLFEMGFDDVDICDFLLKENKGDLQATLALLLEGYPKKGRRSRK